MFHPLPAFIATRYLRSKRKNRFASFISVASVLGIALGVAVLIIVMSVMNGFEVEVTKHILGMTSHASIFGTRNNLEDWPERIRTLKQDPRIIGAAPFIRASGMLNHRGNARGVIIYGIPPAHEREVSDLPLYLGSAQIEALDATEVSVFIGGSLATDLKANIGDVITLIAPRWDPAQGIGLPRYERVKVAGIFNTGMYEFDSSFVMLNLANAARIFDFGDGVTGIRLRLTDPELAPALSVELQKALGPDYALLNWTQYHRNFFYALKSQKRIMFVILSLIVAVAAFNIVASMVMVVKEKNRDIAILRTLGISPAAILGVFVGQGVLIGMVGIIVGIGLGALGAREAHAVVAVLEQWFHVKFIKPDVYYINYLPADLRLGDVAIVSLVAFWICVVSTLFPAWRASKIHPVEALRYE